MSFSNGYAPILAKISEVDNGSSVAMACKHNRVMHALNGNTEFLIGVDESSESVIRRCAAESWKRDPVEIDVFRRSEQGLLCRAEERQQRKIYADIDDGCGFGSSYPSTQGTVHHQYFTHSTQVIMAKHDFWWRIVVRVRPPCECPEVIKPLHKNANYKAINAHAEAETRRTEAVAVLHKRNNLLIKQMEGARVFVKAVVDFGLASNPDSHEQWWARHVTCQGLCLEAAIVKLVEQTGLRINGDVVPFDPRAKQPNFYPSFVC